MYETTKTKHKTTISEKSMVTKQNKKKKAEYKVKFIKTNKHTELSKF